MVREKITHERRHIALRLEIIDELLNSHIKRDYKEFLFVLNKKLREKDEVGISLRTLQYDIAYLENKKCAPVHRPTKKDNKVYYTEKFSLKNIPVDDDDIAVMKKAVAILKKATDTRLSAELEDIITRLENKIHTNVADKKTIIAFEEHTQAKGREYFDELFTAIHEKSTLKISYQPFGKEPREWVIHPYMLKEYRNRWYLIGRETGSNKLLNIGLDRIKGKPRNSSEPFMENDLFNPETYYNNLIGVTFPEDQKEPQNIIIKVKKELVEYIKTKPVHKGQIITKDYKNGGIEISVSLFINYELKSTLLSYGAGIEVMKPLSLRTALKNTFQTCLQLYD
ncbi:helix-turn-helix transcriptional regulator [Parafilimonas sp.]|uniref:helix-turn-helix transcriptional regulator n=1 Tax=Parafilimonas sp. TaxID=1969739 RepID=UPI0039E5186D